MYSHFKEAQYPLTYRQQNIDTIKKALLTQRSVRVVGLSGMGKSNLLRFLVSHPQLLTDAPDFLAESVKFVHIDGNRLHPLNELNFYRECLTQILPPANWPNLSDLRDSFSAYKQVELALQNISPQIFVVLVIDQVDSLYEQAEVAFFNQLRNLRDQTRGGQMAFVLGSRRPVNQLSYLENLFSDVCWVTPLRERDRDFVVQRHCQRLQLELPPTWLACLWHLSGGHPGLLKNSLEWFKRAEQATILAPTQITISLLQI